MSAVPRIETFEYPEMPWTEGSDWFSAQLAESFSDSAHAESRSAGLPSATDAQCRAVTKRDVEQVATAPPPSVSEESLSELLAKEGKLAEERGYKRGVERGLATAREDALRVCKAEQDRLIEQAAALTRTFAEERDRFLLQLEQESAELALAIAARILRHESQIDPLLLTGSVRAALGQLAESTEVRLHVPAQDQALWHEALARMPGLKLRPKVVGEPEMELGDCRVETALGTAISVSGRS